MSRLIENEYRHNRKFREAVDKYAKEHDCDINTALQTPAVTAVYNKMREW